MNVSISEIFLVLLIALLVVKPEQLPEVAHSLVKFIKSVRSVFAKVKNEMNGFIDDVDKKVSDQHEQKQ